MQSNDCILNSRTLADTNAKHDYTCVLCVRVLQQWRLLNIVYGGERIAKPQHRVKTAAVPVQNTRDASETSANVGRYSVRWSAKTIGISVRTKRFAAPTGRYFHGTTRRGRRSRESTPVRSDNRRPCARVIMRMKMYNVNVRAQGFSRFETPCRCTCFDDNSGGEND